MAATIHCDPKKVWRWGNVVAPVLICAVVAGALSVSAPVKDAVTAVAACGTLMLALAYGPCVYWISVTATRRYELDEVSLRVWSRGRLVKEIRREAITGFSMRGYVSAGTIFLVPSRWLSWPKGVVSTRGPDGRQKTVLLPEVVLWGHAALRDAQERFRRELHSV
jgi:hypothetical protein